MSDQVNGGPAERAVWEGLQRAGYGEHTINLLLDKLQFEWLAERKDNHYHSFGHPTGDFDYCQVDGCQMTYVEYLASL